MKIAPPTLDEAARLKALYDYDVLDTNAEKIFDDLTQLAAQICNTPITLISLIDPHRQWFKSRVGLDAEETSRDIAFCAHAIHQKEIFEVFGMSDEEIENKFGHLIKAFQYGCPPHGGCAMGLDRVVMLFADEPNIREVIAFPKNQSAQDLLLGSPSPMPEKELNEQNIQVLPEEEE